jgi:type I restriction enzyme R subunit
VAGGGVVDIYAAAGIETPDISIIDDDFARRLTTNPHPNLQIEALLTDPWVA